MKKTLLIPVLLLSTLAYARSTSTDDMSPIGTSAQAWANEETPLVPIMKRGAQPQSVQKLPISILEEK